MDILHAVIEAIADAKDTEPDELELVLEDYISTEAIQRLDDHENESWHLQFELPNHTVRIDGDGTVLVDRTHEQSYA
jgi:hypothetical protein